MGKDSKSTGTNMSDPDLMGDAMTDEQREQLQRNLAQADGQSDKQASM